MKNARFRINRRWAGSICQIQQVTAPRRGLSTAATHCAHSRLASTPRHLLVFTSKMAIIKKTPEQIELMAAAGDVLVRTMSLLAGKIRPGVTTLELDQADETFHRVQR